MSLTPAQIRKLKDVFNEIVEKHPNPDSRLLHPGLEHFDPTGVCKKNSRTKTPIGQYFFDMIDDAVTNGKIPFDRVIAELRKPPKPL